MYYVITAVMLVTAGLSWFWNSAVFYTEMVLSVLAVAAVVLANAHFQLYVNTAVKSAKKILSASDYRAIEGFALPVALVGASGDIIWVNARFADGVCQGRTCQGENILKFIYPKTLRQVLEGDGADVTVGDRQYTVYAISTQNGSVLYFVDDTYYKNVSLEHSETRPIVAIVTFDNRDELSRDSSGSEDARIASEVEAALRNWAQEMGGFLKKLSGGRYLVLTDEAHVRAATEKRFAILDAVRTIKTAENRSATISMGVGRGTSSLSESEQWARQALDMALGRGGDQVAVKQKDDSYEFFGGLSKGVEKRDKVRTRVIAATLCDHIAASDSVFIMGHKFSDLDSVGAAVGMWSAVSRGLKKPAHVVVNRAQSLANSVIASIEEAETEQKVFVSPAEALTMITGKSLLIIVDTHSQDFVESVELLDTAARVVVIDHHRMMVKHISNAIVFYHEPYASSASELVTELVQYIGEKTLSRAEAEALLAGIMLDTKGFVLKTGVRTFEAAAYLRRRGADTVEVKRLFSNSIETYKAKYRLVSSAELYNNCAIACEEKEFPDIRIAAAQAADELLSIQGVSASFVIFPTGNAVNISARSLGDVNVQVIMEAVGGGGHLTMAAAQLADTAPRQARDTLVSVLNNLLPQASKMPVTGVNNNK